ncbi:MAG TPA: toll/interleukin-1 receptor domain-containing protein [Accumulibacter sp.]|nr:toll/interleukin-1 receptor domain-containing protein [Accumulibacter sp.]HMW16519.1 toll/interleukin-1 receptor domain-containing protein [Accumulibacter sp.]HMY06698.1 toll/interleukin-1 receptor domain-containing protein [Accumulibacter sp.]HND78983.1 toll/interleukin-1 receptor domain-containing protein [Accumulibacter sp.]HNL12677.1 toll/interleukin-1 receptor domain-containing protein [Accumulibacter sp.]
MSTAAIPPVPPLPPPTTSKRLTTIVGGIIALPLAVVGGLGWLFAGLFRQRRRALAFAQALARSPRIGRWLAAGGALSVLISSSIVLDPTPGVPWSAASIGVLFGVGGALLVLPEWLGWPRRITGWVAFGLLTLTTASEWLRVSLTPSLPAGLGFLGGLVPSLLIGGAGLLLLPTFLGAHSSLIGLLTALVGGLVLSALGAVSLLSAAAAIIDLWNGPGYSLLIECLPAVACGLVALVLTGFEGRLISRWPVHLLRVRSALLRFGAVLAGAGVALYIYPPLFTALWRLIFATPLAGLAVAISALLSALAGLTTAAFFLLLPRALARWQLAGRLTANAAGETGWFVALLLITSSSPLGLSSAFEIYTNLPEESALAVAGVLTVAAYTVLRLLLGRPPSGHPSVATSSAAATPVPLLLFLPERTPTAASAALAERVTRAWIGGSGAGNASRGPVIRVAPSPAALRIAGPHLWLAQQAGLLSALFVDEPGQTGRWRRLRLASELAVSALPLTEIYGGATAWQTALADASAGARVLVIVGDSPLAWDADFFAALPEHGEIVGDAAVDWPSSDRERQTMAFADTRQRADWLHIFQERQRPAAEATRRLLLLYQNPQDQGDSEGDQAALAQALAAALDGQTDSDGLRIVASPLASTLNSLAVLRLDGRSLAAAFSLGARFAVREADRRTGLQISLIRAMARYWLALYPARIDVLVLETTLASDGNNALANGLDQDADTVYSLLPAEADADEGPRLYERSTYRATWRLPPRSALDPARVAELARRWLDGRWAPLPPPADKTQVISPSAVAEEPVEFGAASLSSAAPVPEAPFEAASPAFESVQSGESGEGIEGGTPWPPAPPPSPEPAPAAAKKKFVKFSPELETVAESEPPLLPVKAYVLYASQDQSDYLTLRRHLAACEADGLIAFRQDAPQENDWAAEIAATLAETELVLVLLSTEFLTSTHCLGELEQVLQRSLNGQARLIPIHLRSNDALKLIPMLGRFQGFQLLPAAGRPIAETPDPEKTFADIARVIRQVLDELRPKTSPDDPPPPFTKSAHK